MGKYYICTIGKQFIIMNGIEPSDAAVKAYGMTECSFFTYNVFKYLYINLKARNKLAWLWTMGSERRMNWSVFILTNMLYVWILVATVKSFFE